MQEDVGVACQGYARVHALYLAVDDPAPRAIQGHQRRSRSRRHPTMAIPPTITYLPPHALCPNAPHATPHGTPGSCPSVVRGTQNILEV